MTGDAGGRRRRGGTPTFDEHELASVVAAVLRSCGASIGGYATEFLIAIVAGAISTEGVADVTALVERIETEPACASRLLDSLRISTTSLFRDPIMYRAIRRDVVPALRAEGNARIWVAGCSTGEEVYSLAIVLRDEGLLERCRIYATDVNVTALDVARRGDYSSSAIREGTRRYHSSGGRGTLCEVYSAQAGHVTFDSTLRANVVFAIHDLGVDGRFQDFQLILCRNVMIWFGPKTRDAALELVRTSLQPGGTLVLGRREDPNDSPTGARFERVRAGESLWRLAGSRGPSSGSGIDAVELAELGATEPPGHAISDASTRAAASDQGASLLPLDARTPEPSLAFP